MQTFLIQDIRDKLDTKKTAIRSFFPGSKSPVTLESTAKATYIVIPHSRLCLCKNVHVLGYRNHLVHNSEQVHCNVHFAGSECPRKNKSRIAKQVTYQCVLSFENNTQRYVENINAILFTFLFGWHNSHYRTCGIEAYYIQTHAVEIIFNVNIST